MSHKPMFRASFGRKAAALALLGASAGSLAAPAVYPTPEPLPQQWVGTAPTTVARTAGRPALRAGAAVGRGWQEKMACLACASAVLAVGAASPAGVLIMAAAGGGEAVALCIGICTVAYS